MTRKELLQDLRAKPWFGGFVLPDTSTAVTEGVVTIELSRPREDRLTTFKNGDNVYRVYFLEIAGKVIISRFQDIYETAAGAAYYSGSEPGPTIQV